jgi:hypothetical protein
MFIYPVADEHDSHEDEYEYSEEGEHHDEEIQEPIIFILAISSSYLHIRHPGVGHCTKRLQTQSKQYKWVGKCPYREG